MISFKIFILFLVTITKTYSISNYNKLLNDKMNYELWIPEQKKNVTSNACSINRKTRTKQINYKIN